MNTFIISIYIVPTVENSLKPIFCELNKGLGTVVGEENEKE